METCKICNSEFDNLKGLAAHFNLKHNLTSKEYYDSYLLKGNEGKCVVCSKDTTFRNLGVGYLQNCSMSCRDLNKTIKRDHLKGKKQSNEVIQKRINNTNQEIKEAARKNTMLKTYGVDNPMKLDGIKSKVSSKLKGGKLERNSEWQENIIKSKRENGTLKHTDETKRKIKDSLNTYHENNLDRAKYLSKSNTYLCGWYNDLYFRSSLELSFLIYNQNKNIVSCENNQYKVIYEKNGKHKSYYPDFTDGEFIYEIKPSSLLTYNDNDLKIKKAIEFFGAKFKVITENEIGYLEKTKILELIDNGIIKVNEKSLKVLQRYKF